MEREIAEIQAFLETHVSGDSPVEIQERGHNLAVYMARTGHMLAQAKQALNEAKKVELSKTLDRFEYAPKAALNELVKSLCSREQYIVDWLERLNKSCTHQLDWMRSALSYEKEQIRNNLQT